jgi:pilus assembly protein Flp/PilA
MGIKIFFKRFIQEEEGATAVEYAIMVALIGAVAIAAVTFLGGEVSAEFQSVGASINGMGS